MPKVLNLQKENEVTLVLDYLIESDEYQQFKSKTTRKLLADVEVPGFRKGKAPENLLMKNVNEIALASSILQQTIDKYAPQATELIRTEAEKDNRDVQIIELSDKPEEIKESEQGFQFRLIATLYPEVDLDNLKKLDLKDPKEDELSPGRPTLDLFLNQEKGRFLSSFNNYKPSEGSAEKMDQLVCNMKGKVDGQADSKLDSQNVQILLGAGNYLPDLENGLFGMKSGETKAIEVNFPETYFEKSLAGKKAHFDVEVVSLQKPEYQTIEEVFEKSQEAQAQFKSAAEFEDFLKSFYDAETKRLVEDHRRINASKQIVQVVPDFPLPENKIEEEANRIVTVLQNQASKNKTSLFEEFKISGIPGADDSKVKDDLQIKQLILEYVRKEFKLATILHLVYKKLVEKKLTSQQIDHAAMEISRAPERFGLSQSASEVEIREMAADRLQRQSALDKILELNS